jgi:RNA polymerase-binding transcription factor DksA
MKNQKAVVKKASKADVASGKRKPAKSKPARVRAAKVDDVLGENSLAVRASAPVPAKWRWHHNVLLSLQSRLQERGGRLQRAAAEPLEPHSLDEADSATDEFDHDLALTQLAAERDALYEVTEALARIRDGSYGICEETGKKIPAARLEAIPWTRFTREVEARLEKEREVGLARLGKPRTVRNHGELWLSPEDETQAEPSVTPKDEALGEVYSPGRKRQAKRTRLPQSSATRKKAKRDK